MSDAPAESDEGNGEGKGVGNVAVYAEGVRFWDSIEILTIAKFPDIDSLVF